MLEVRRVEPFGQSCGRWRQLGRVGRGRKITAYTCLSRESVWCNLFGWFEQNPQTSSLLGCLRTIKHKFFGRWKSTWNPIVFHIFHHGFECSWHSVHVIWELCASEALGRSWELEGWLEELQDFETSSWLRFPCFFCFFLVSWSFFLRLAMFLSFFYWFLVSWSFFFSKGFLGAFMVFPECFYGF